MAENDLEIRSEDIIFLLGAGASEKAGIPISSGMVKKVETLIENDSDWITFRDLYNYLKSSILYSKGIFGEFDNAYFNIENLLIIISNLKEKDENPIYPFIGSWDLRLIDLAGKDFKSLKEFEKIIRSELLAWVVPRQYKNASYYKGFNKLKNEINQTLKVFSLNYDLCFEKVIGEDNVETGFGNGDEWHYSNFDLESNTKDFYLYKLHGSINWYIDEQSNKLKKSEKIEKDPQLIFGIEHKLQSKDPYFFYSSELRKASLDSKIIITIGYGFEDAYLNGILAQALSSNSLLSLISVQPTQEIKEFKTKIKNRLAIDTENQIIVEANLAEKFLQKNMKKSYFSDYIKNDIF